MVPTTDACRELEHPTAGVAIAAATRRERRVPPAVALLPAASQRRVSRAAGGSDALTARYRGSERSGGARPGRPHSLQPEWIAAYRLALGSRRCARHTTPARATLPPGALARSAGYPCRELDSIRDAVRRRLGPPRTAAYIKPGCHRAPAKLDLAWRALLLVRLVRPGGYSGTRCVLSKCSITWRSATTSCTSLAGWRTRRSTRSPGSGTRVRPAAMWKHAHNFRSPHLHERLVRELGDLATHRSRFDAAQPWHPIYLVPACLLLPHGRWFSSGHCHLLPGARRRARGEKPGPRPVRRSS